MSRTLTASPDAIGVVGAPSNVIVTVFPFTLVIVPLKRDPPPNPPPANPEAPAAAPAPAPAKAPAPPAPAAPVNAPPAAAPRIRDANPASALFADDDAFLLPYQIPPETDAVTTTNPASTAVYLLVHL